MKTTKYFKLTEKKNLWSTWQEITFWLAALWVQGGHAPSRNITQNSLEKSSVKNDTCEKVNLYFDKWCEINPSESQLVANLIFKYFQYRQSQLFLSRR